MHQINPKETMNLTIENPEKMPRISVQGVDEKGRQFLITGNLKMKYVFERSDDWNPSCMAIYDLDGDAVTKYLDEAE